MRELHEDLFEVAVVKFATINAEKKTAEDIQDRKWYYIICDTEATANEIAQAMLDGEFTDDERKSWFVTTPIKQLNIFNKSKIIYNGI